MPEDIAPALLERIQEEFNKALDNEDVKKLLAMIADDRGTYGDLYQYADAMGEALAVAYKKCVSSDVLPEGRMFYNIARRVIDIPMENNYSLVADQAETVQASLNKSAKIGMAAQRPELVRDKIDGIVNRVSHEENFDSVRWILDAPIRTFTKSVVDDAIEQNAEFQYKAGLTPKIIRISTGNCCDWCDAVAGVYTYPNVPKDVYRRHNNCNCIVSFNPGDGKRVQDVHTKRWRSAEENRKDIAQIYKARKTKDHTRPNDTTKEYIRNAKPKSGKISNEEGFNEIERPKETKIAHWLHKTFGGDIINKAEKNINNVKTPDFEWNGKLWELKSPTTGKAAEDAIKRGLKQIRENPGGIILDYEKHKFNLNTAKYYIHEKMRRTSIHADIMIISNNKLVVVLRY